MTEPTAPVLAVSGLLEAYRDWAGFDAVISVEDVHSDQVFRLRDRPGNPEHLILRFTDVDFEHSFGEKATRAHIEEALDFARKHADRRLLVHCHMGRYRSAAVALAILADRLGPGNEADAVQALLQARPVAAPNLIALACADEALRRGGALTAAWLTHEQTDADIARRRAIRRDIESRSWPAEQTAAMPKP